MKKHLAYYVKGLSGGKTFKQAVFESKDMDGLYKALDGCPLMDLPL